MAIFKRIKLRLATHCSNSANLWDDLVDVRYVGWESPKLQEIFELHKFLAKNYY